MDKKKVQIEELFQAILLLENKDEASKFFSDLLTKQEITEFSNRWQAARMLNDKVPYLVIEEKTGLSSTTIARISKWLNNGKGGYKLALKKMIDHPHINSVPDGKGLS